MISFIIPAYNSANIIKRTIDSILNQKTDLEYEIIIVDDGSTDDLYKTIFKYYFNKKEKVKYFYKENGGISEARNYGITKASGDYIIFVDHDDYISDNLLNDISEYIKDDIELIKWNPIWVNNNGNEIKREPAISSDKIITGEEGFNLLYGVDPMLICVWEYCFKKSIFEEFPVGRFHEDFAIMPFIMLNAKTMAITDKYEYYYVQTEGSIMRTTDKEKSKKKLEDMLNNFDDMIRKTETLKVDKKTKENLAIFGTYSLIAKCNDLEGEALKNFKKELKKRKIIKHIKVRGVKSFIKKVYLMIKY